MYLSYYNLKNKPFQISTDPKFLWLGEKHKEALATLKYGILDNKGFLLLTGDVGTGKTTLINTLISSLGNDVIAAAIPDPGLEALDLFNFIANSFKMNKKFDSKGAFLVHLNDFLHNAHTNGKKVLLIVDESQRLNRELLEEIRLLSNIEKQDTKLINIFFVGQNEFNDILLDHENRALRQRITISYNIDPLTENETGEYIRYRLRVAGSEKKIFNSSAISEIFSFSKGYPRLINIICDLALLSGYVKEKKIINADIISESAEELQIRSTQKATDNKKQQISEEIEYKPVEDIKYKPVKKIRQKNQGRAKKYIIGLTAILVIIAGYIYYSGKDYDTPIKIKNTQEQATNSKKVLKSEHSIQKVKANSYPLPEIQHDSTYTGKISPPEPDKTNSPKPESPEPSVPENTNPSGIDSAPKKSIPIPKDNIVIYFGYNSNDLSNDAYEKLDRIAEILTQNPHTEIIIKGYTDSSGVRSYNKSLSKFRANIVKNYFVAKGISPMEIKAIGMGPENPKEKNVTLKEKRTSRRVEIEFKSNKPE